MLKPCRASMTKVEYKAKGSSITCPSQKHRLPDKITAKTLQDIFTKSIKTMWYQPFYKTIQYNHASNNAIGNNGNWQTDSCTITINKVEHSYSTWDHKVVAPKNMSVCKISFWESKPSWPKNTSVFCQSQIASEFVHQDLYSITWKPIMYTVCTATILHNTGGQFHVHSHRHNSTTLICQGHKGKEGITSQSHGNKPNNKIAASSTMLTAACTKWNWLQPTMQTQHVSHCLACSYIKSSWEEFNKGKWMKEKKTSFLNCML